MPKENDVKNWIVASEGQALDYDGAYGLQCFDYFNFYMKHFWNMDFTGHWIDPGDVWYNGGESIRPNGFSTIGGCAQKDIKCGDIIMWGNPYSNPYGHVAIALDNQYLYDENGGGHNEPVTKRPINNFQGHSTGAYIGVWRPNIEYNDGTSSGTQPLTPQQEFVQEMDKLGWNRDSTFAVMGSIDGESYFNPMQYEGTPAGEQHRYIDVINAGWQGGWGLIQWTPPQKIAGYPEHKAINTARVQADIIDDFFNTQKHQWFPNGTGDSGGTTLAVINQYREQSGWANVDWDRVIYYNLEFYKFYNDSSNTSLETRLAYFIVCCERPNFSDALNSYPKRLAGAQKYKATDWSITGNQPPNGPDGGTGDKEGNTSESGKEEPEDMMSYMLLLEQAQKKI